MIVHENRNSLRRKISDFSWKVVARSSESNEATKKGGQEGVREKEVWRSVIGTRERIRVRIMYTRGPTQ